MSNEGSGLMTNAVAELLKIAQEAGFESLTALTKLDNEKSENVLTRTGFVVIDENFKEDDKVYKRFQINF